MELPTGEFSWGRGRAELGAGWGRAGLELAVASTVGSYPPYQAVQPQIEVLKSPSAK